MLVTEFVSAEGIFHKNAKTHALLKFEEMERPVGIQLFGADPYALAEAGKRVMDWIRPDFIDLNFGCPVSKVVAKNGGSALLKDCPLLARIATQVVEALSPVPVTAKIRIGWSASTINAVEVSRLLEGCGIQAIAVHGRTKDQAYGGVANWEVIQEVVQAVTIPVIGNGDIASAEDVLRRKKETGVAGVMIGRAAMNSPWIFREAKDYLETGMKRSAATFDDRWDWMERHTALEVEECGRLKPAIHSMRARLMAYSKGWPGGKWLRCRFQKIESLEELHEIRLEHRKWLVHDLGDEVE